MDLPRTGTLVSAEYMCFVIFVFIVTDLGEPVSSWFLPNKNPRASQGEGGNSRGLKGWEGGTYGMGGSFRAGRRVLLAHQKLTVPGSAPGATLPWGQSFAVSHRDVFPEYSVFRGKKAAIHKGLDE